MKQEQFEARHAPEWNAFAQWIDYAQLPRPKRAKTSAPFDETEVPARYRELCRQLAVARSRDYSLWLIDRLHRLTLDGHDLLYARGSSGSGWLRWLAVGFAQSVRRHWRSVLASGLLFYGPYVALMLAIRLWPDFGYVVLPAEMLDKFEQMYGPATESLGRTRNAGSDVAMFGYYISHNVGIGFQTFGGGVFAGIGTIFALLYNGAFLGGVEAHVVNLGYAERFYSFVSGHSSFELTAIVLCGAAGLQLGWAIIAPGLLSRSEALKRAGRESIGIVAGAAMMFLIAAGIEAFWSPRDLPPNIKYGVGACNWVLVLGYFLLAGRRHEP
jgi:uncharacterized membrane protein SpoIIM required for sporulation